MSKIVNVDITMYGIAEVLHWCHTRNKGRVGGVDTAGFEKMKAGHSARSVIVFDS